MEKEVIIKAIAALLSIAGVGGGSFFIFKKSGVSQEIPTAAATSKYISSDSFVNNAGSSDYKLPPSYFLSTDSEENEAEWQKRLEVVKKKLNGNSGSSASKSPVSGGFFEGAKKDDSDLLVKVKQGCEKFYRSEKPNDNSVFTEPKWVEATMFCGRGSYVKLTK